jgi:hypothetical protein
MQSLRRKSKILTVPSLHPATSSCPLWLNVQHKATAETWLESSVRTLCVKAQHKPRIKSHYRRSSATILKIQYFHLLTSHISVREISLPTYTQKKRYTYISIIVSCYKQNPDTGASQIHLSDDELTQIGVKYIFSLHTYTLQITYHHTECAGRKF